MDNMQEIPEIANVFTEEDKEFNRKMVKRGMSYGKMPKLHPEFFEDRNYDFSSEIPDYSRKKLGIE